MFCAHHHDCYPKSNDKMGPDVSLAGRNIGSDFSNKDGFNMYHGEVVPGFPAHPHLGFETVTVTLEGLIDHFDSLGATGRYGNGDVQWLTTGSGCQHSEMFPLLYHDKPNPLELFQIWLNLPIKSKQAKPYYQMFWVEDVPEVHTEDANGNKIKVRLIAGNYKGKQSLQPNPDSWAHDPANHVSILVITLAPHAMISLPAVSETITRNLYFYSEEGTVTIDDEIIKAGNRIRLNGNADIDVENGDFESRLLLLEGEPINEPVAQYGPFVANDEDGLQKAFARYRETEFGGWPWGSYDVVHPRETGRFAKYDDGRVEYK